MIIRYLNRSWLGALGLSLCMCSCNDEEQFEPLESQKIISEITLKVSDPLPLLINTDSLVAYEVLPEDANNKNVIWTSSNEEIASVDAEGRIYANNFGKAFITVAPEAGFAGIKTVEVEVIDRIIPIKEIQIKNTDLSVYATASLQLETSYLPLEATYSSLSWTSLTPEIASVTDEGLVKGLVPGNAVIRVEARDGGGCFKDVAITVKEVQPLTDIIFKEGQEEVAMYETSKLLFTPIPADATTSTIQWSSTDNNVVSINQETGVYYVKGYGSTVITAKSGDVEANITLTVAPGKINDTFLYGATNWRGFSKDYASAEIVDGKFVVTPGTNQKASIERIYDTDFHAGNYPIVAIKRTDPATSYSMVMDMWTDKNYGAYKGQIQKIIDPADNVPVYYVDISAAQFGSMTLPKDKAETLDVFVYRMNNLRQTENISYSVYWIKSFKSVDELKKYVGVE